MKTKKTYRELVESNIFWNVFAIGLCSVIVVLFFMAIIITSQRDELKTQLSECQEQVPVWTLKILCEGENSWMEDVQSYYDYEEYEFWVKLKPSYIEHLNPLWKNCDVIE